MLGGGHGALTKGDFVMHARNIFLRDQAVFSSPRAEKLGDRAAIRLDYEVPVAKSNFEIRADGQKAVVGYKGTAWVDENTLQLLRISIEAEGIPSKIRVRSMRSEINYAMVQLGDAKVLLPSSSQYTLQHSSRVDLSSRIEFSGCRQYGATSNLSFDDTGRALAPRANSAAKFRCRPAWSCPFGWRRALTQPQPRSATRSLPSPRGMFCCWAAWCFPPARRCAAEFARWNGTSNPVHISWLAWSSTSWNGARNASHSWPR